MKKIAFILTVLALWWHPADAATGPNEDELVLVRTTTVILAPPYGYAMVERENVVRVAEQDWSWIFHDYGPGPFWPPRLKFELDHARSGPSSTAWFYHATF